jgi:hypothetical protein
MRVDIYTKAILTIIAVCLLWLCLRGTTVIPVAEAQTSSATQKVHVAGWIDANGEVHLLPTKSQNKNSALPVDAR